MTTSTGIVDVVVPAWGEYLDLLPRAVASAANAGARVIAVVDEVERSAVRRIGCDIAVPRPRGGVGAARNAGLTAVTRQHVLFLDADDELIPGRLEHLSYLLERTPRRVLAVTSPLRRRSDQTLWPCAWRARLACAPGGGPTLLFANALPMVSSCVMKTHRLPRGGLFPDLEDEDWHAAVRLRSRGGIAFVPKPGADYRDSDGTTSRRSRDRARLEASHTRLVCSSGTPPHWWWRTVDLMARSSRTRHREELLSRWGEV